LCLEPRSVGLQLLSLSHADDSGLRLCLLSRNLPFYLRRRSALVCRSFRCGCFRLLDCFRGSKPLARFLPLCAAPLGLPAKFFSQKIAATWIASIGCWPKRWKRLAAQ
jgi:hypothetical protein